MKTTLRLKWLTGIMFIFIATGLFGQDAEKKLSVGEVVYEEYQQNGIDKALLKYEELKKENKDEYSFDEWQLNNLGYRLMLDENDMAAAEKVFSYNMKEYPKAANPNDSYADYLIEKGDTEEARKYLQKSMDIAKNSKNEDERTRIYNGSKAKLAKLENRHRQMDFLVGNWAVNSTWYKDGAEIGGEASNTEISYDEDFIVLTINHKNSQGKSTGKRILVYDAVNDEYDMAYTSSTEPIGIRSSSMKLTDLGNNKVEFLESYIDWEGEEKQARHELVKTNDDKLDWSIYETRADDQGWEQVVFMNFDKKT